MLPAEHPFEKGRYVYVVGMRISVDSAQLLLPPLSADMSSVLLHLGQLREQVDETTVPLALSQLPLREPALTVVQSHVLSSPQLLLVVAT